MTLMEIARVLREAKREGAVEGETEGRCVIISDTLATTMADSIERSVAKDQRLIMLS